MRKLVFLLIAFFTLSTDIVEYAYFQKFDPQAKERSVYIYGFTKNFDWPNKEGDFVITIIGDNPGLVAELKNLAKTKTVGAQKIDVQNHPSQKEFDKSNIIFITPEKSGILNDVVSKFKSKGSLIVTEKAGLAKVGAAINFIVEDSKLKFELNKTVVAKTGLNVSSSLEKMAKNVIN
ncbi:MAG: YfiR family protein [Bacteroidia bacterium]